jgi:hypothetical protein
MDKVKAQLALVKQHSFWVMCGGILIVCLVSWYMSTKAINSEREKQLTDIKQVFDGLKTIRDGNPKHPNASTEQGMEVLNRAKSEDVLKAWQMQFDRQADILVWPPSFREDPAFIQQVEKLRPIEVVPFPTPITSDIDQNSRRLYRDYITTEIPHLAEIIGATFVATAAAGGTGDDGFGGGYGAGPGGGLGAIGGGIGGGLSGLGGGIGGASGSYPGGASGYAGGPGTDGSGLPLIEDKSIVLWNPANQQQLLNTHFGFVTREIAPTTLEVLYAQEDLWVLENIMQIIREANGDATARHEAAIKYIDFVRLGRSAIGLAGNITPVGAVAGAMGGMDGGMMPGGMMSSGAMGGPGAVGTAGADVAGATAGTGSPDGGMTSEMPGGMGAMGGMMGGAAVAVDPAYGRYVDEKYAPLDPAKLRSALTSQNKDDALLAVAKRMPVRLRFRIDQRKMNKLLAECGNSKLPVEVRQVRLNRPAAPEGGGTGGYGGYGGDMAGGYGGSTDGGYGGGMPGGMGGMPGMGGMSGMGGSIGSDDGGGYSPGGYSSGGYGGYGGAGGIGGAMGGASGFPGSGMAGGAARAVGGASSTATADYNLVDVELYGIVYIYNPANRSQLGLEPAGTAAAAPATPAPAAVTTPTTPASSPSPPATAPPGTPPAAIVPGVGAG